MHEGFLETQPSMASELQLPKRISRLPELAYNLWWTWHPQAQNLFSRIDFSLWEDVRHNPVQFLRNAKRPQLNAALSNVNYLETYDRVMDAFDHYLNASDTWYQRENPDLLNRPIAYFSTEYGLHESIQGYAGGLGVLAGDLLKEASDLGIPVVGLGFLYTLGYFRQKHNRRRLAGSGSTSRWISPTCRSGRCSGATAAPLTISVSLPGRELCGAPVAGARRTACPLYLLDSNVECNVSVRPRADRPPLHQRSGAAHLAGDHPRHRRRARAARARLQPHRLAPQRGPFRLRAAGAGARICGGRPDRSPKRGRSSARPPSSPPTRRSRPARTNSRSWLMDKFFSAYWPQLGLERDAFLDHRPATSNPGAKRSACRSSHCASPTTPTASRSCTAGSRGTCSSPLAGPPGRPGSDPPHHQRHPHRHLAGAPDGRRCSTGTSDADWRERIDEQAVWDKVLRHPGPGTVGRFASTSNGGWSPTSATARGSSGFPEKCIRSRS